ncbi:MAG: acetylxylan esterase [Thermoguttaceae bacterium]
MKARCGTLWMLLMICRFGMAGEPASAPAAKPDLSTMTTPALPFPTVADLKPVPDPEPLVFLDGRKVKTKGDWQARKKEIMDLLQHYIYGFSPPEKFVDGAPPPEVTKEEKDVLGGLATRREIKVCLTPDRDDPQGAIWLSLVLPNKGEGPFPCVLQFERPGEMTEYAIRRGYAVAGFSPQSGLSLYKYYFPVHSGPWVTGDDPRFYVSQPRSDIRSMGRRLLHGWGERAIWGWRMRRMMDALVTQKDIDAERVIFTGGSRGGASALMAAALDERAAMVYCWQGLPKIRDHIFRPQWHAPHAQEFVGRLDRLPVDLYCAAATIAPRPILFTEAREGSNYVYSSTPFVYEKIASAYRFLGADVTMEKDPGPGHEGMYSRGVLGMHIRDGGHAGFPSDWKNMLDFADAHMKAKP